MAHIPNVHQSNLLIYQKLRYVGDGFMEVTYGFQNFGEDVTYNFLSAPWAPIRTSNLPFQHLAQNGTIRRQYANWPDHPRIALSDTDGFFMNGRWIVPQKQLRGMSLVFGQEDDVHFRWGEVDTAGRDLTVQSTQRYANIAPGESYWTRYYIGVHDYPDLRLRSLDLVDSAFSGYGDAPAPAFEYIEDNVGWVPTDNPNDITDAPYRDRIPFRLAN
jgi:hypothetical protein